MFASVIATRSRAMIAAQNFNSPSGDQRGMTMTYKLIGSPCIQSEYSDKWETTMICDVRREDGVLGDVWIVAGVPDYHQGSSRAAGHQQGFERVRVFGQSPAEWLSDSLMPSDEDDLSDAENEAADTLEDISSEILAAVESAALAVRHLYRADHSGEE